MLYYDGLCKFEVSIQLIKLEVLKLIGSVVRSEERRVGKECA